MPVTPSHAAWCAALAFLEVRRRRPPSANELAQLAQVAFPDADGLEIARSSPALADALAWLAALPPAQPLQRKVIL